MRWDLVYSAVIWHEYVVVGVWWKLSPEYVAECELYNIVVVISCG